MIRFLLRLFLYLFIACVVLVVAGILLLDTIAREITQYRIRTETGMGCKIGKMTVGLLNPTVTIENFKLYNTAEFGASQCLDIPELHVEYDVNAARAGKLHLRLVRFNMAEVDILKDKKGRTNFDQLQKRNGSLIPAKPATPKPGTPPPRAPFEFTGIDTLNLTLQKAHIANVDPPRQERNINFGIKNQIFHNIKTEADLMGVATMVYLKMPSQGDAVEPGVNGVLKQLLP